ncbi:hypothetical protein R1flu_024258 [Riccia fluitans]|uniref:DUF659 domain-containing protein n=1 Tax=Riccia fluitans TaxID=41844 RepID=A0ABD1XXE4_9MARC
MAQVVMGLPFRIFSHPAFQEAYRFSSQFAGYKLPSEKRLHTTLLDVNYQAIKEETKKKMFNRMVWDKATISCDGWTNVNGRPQMNIMFINRYGEAVHRHIDGSNEIKNSVWIADHIITNIEERGPKMSSNSLRTMLPLTSWRENWSFIQFIKNHHMPNAMFLDYFSNGASLLKPLATKFTTNVIMLDRAWSLESCLKRMVVSDR